MIYIRLLGTCSGLRKERLSHTPGKTNGGEYVVSVFKSKLKGAKMRQWGLSASKFLVMLFLRRTPTPKERETGNGLRY